MNDYADFLRIKTQSNNGFGFKATWIPDFLIDFQASMVRPDRQGRLSH